MSIFKSDNPNYDNLYIDVLKIGRKTAKDGLSYNTLKEELIKKNYDFSCDCIELAIKQWFYDNFHHKGSDKKLVSFDDFENHLTCNFIMKGDACLKLIDYENSKRNILIAFISMFLAILSILFSIYSTTDKSSASTEKKEICQ